MRVSLEWLKSYVEFDWSPKELGDRLTMVGLEVEGIIQPGQGLENVVVGEVVAVARHPHADHLSVCRVNINQKRPLKIVCGAPNVAPGQKVPVALAGAELPHGTRIRKVPIRSQISEGMICSEWELGLSQKQNQIMVLSPASPVGAPLVEVLGKQDVILDLSITTNRPDCMCLTGVAREVAALTGQPLQMPRVQLTESGPPIEDLVTITLDDPEGCPRFVARVIQGVKVGPSPEWLVRRLETAGIRSINNVVDVTNYVLLELGQPLHAYDYDKLAEQRIVVRRARTGEQFTTLDGKTQVLLENILMIADGRAGVGIAGIMGGLDSEVTEQTHNVLIESAYFNPTVIRRGAKWLGLRTEASIRFERGLDPNGQVRAADRATALIAELAGGQIARGRWDVQAQKVKPRTITLRTERVNGLLGTALSREQIIDYLTSLTFQVKEANPLQVTVPTFRTDITREVDLIEEVARRYGYEYIRTETRPRNLACGESRVSMIDADADRLRETIRETLVGMGLTEIITNTLVDPHKQERVVPDLALLTVMNPPSPGQSVMRATLIPSVLETVRWNLNRQIADVRLFEIGRIFIPRQPGTLPDERLRLCGALVGRRLEAGWSGHQGTVDWFDLKGILEVLLARLALDRGRYVRYDGEVLNRKNAAVIRVKDQEMGCFGEVAPEMARVFDLDEPVYLFDLDFHKLVRFSQVTTRQFQPLPRFPYVERDLAVVVAETVSCETVQENMRNQGGEVLEDVALFDVYRGRQVPEGQKSLAFRLRFRSPDRTLIDAEVDAVCSRIVQHLADELNARLR